jgi:DNA repair protein RecN (Recombination protein N)
MLSELQVEDFALVRTLKLEFTPGFIVFTGETGAGKSILLGALGLALGERSDGGVVRAGAERTLVSAVFDLEASPVAREWLADQGLEASDGLAILRRQLGVDGRSRCQVNGQTVTLGQLRELAGLLIDVHGQNTHHSLVKAEEQRSLLDAWAGHEALLAGVAAAHRELDELRSAAERLAAADPSLRERELELLEHGIEALTALDCTIESLSGLEQAHSRLAHASTLQEGAAEVMECLDEGEPSARVLVDRAARRLRELSRFDERLGSVAEALEGAGITLAEAHADLRHLVGDAEHDPAELARLEARLAAVHAAARRHRCAITELPEVLTRLQAERVSLLASEDEARRIATLLAAAEVRYREAALALSQARQQAAPRFASAVTEQMQGLALGGGRLQVSIESDPDRPARHGTDRVEFLVTTNAGVEPRPLARVASGGEVARIALAIQVVRAHVAGVPTLIFDEVDSGIGGRTAEVVGLALRGLAQHRQVLCVTHLAQVAAQGAQHFAVSKQSEQSTTTTRVNELDAQGRVHEIARMLSGLELTPESLSHAAAMLVRARG